MDWPSSESMAFAFASCSGDMVVVLVPVVPSGAAVSAGDASDDAAGAADASVVSSAIVEEALEDSLTGWTVEVEVSSTIVPSVEGTGTSEAGWGVEDGASDGTAAVDDGGTSEEAAADGGASVDKIISVIAVTGAAVVEVDVDSEVTTASEVDSEVTTSSEVVWEVTPATDVDSVEAGLDSGTTVVEDDAGKSSAGFSWGGFTWALEIIWKTPVVL